MPHHTGERLPLGVALRLPHVAHMYGGGAVDIILTLPLTSPIQLCLPEHLSSGTAALRYAGGYQRLIPTVQQSCGAGRHVHFWLHCLKESEEEMRQSEGGRGRGGNDRMEKILEN